MQQSNLIIPAYLNQRIVFDLLAMLQDGLATVTKVSEAEVSKGADERRYGAAFGLNKAFSTLLRIDFSGQIKKINEDSSQTAKSEEKIHTPASLLYKLRNILLETKKLTEVGSDYNPVSGQLIEFTSVLNRNPLIQTMDALIKMMNMASIFADKEQPKSKGRKSQPKPGDENKKILSQMEEFRKELNSGETVDILSNKLEFGYESVITLENEFLNDPYMSDLVDGTFKVIGKIIRVIPSNDGKISLIRKTALSVMPTEILQGSLGHLGALSSSQGFGLPELKWEIEGPVIQIIPVAIFA